MREPRFRWRFRRHVPDGHGVADVAFLDSSAANAQLARQITLMTFSEHYSDSVGNYTGKRPCIINVISKAFTLKGLEGALDGANWRRISTAATVNRNIVDSPSSICQGYRN